MVPSLLERLKLVATKPGVLAAAPGFGDAGFRVSPSATVQLSIGEPFEEGRRRRDL